MHHRLRAALFLLVILVFLGVASLVLYALTTDISQSFPPVLLRVSECRPRAEAGALHRRRFAISSSRHLPRLSADHGLSL